MRLPCPVSHGAQKRDYSQCVGPEAECRSWIMCENRVQRYTHTDENHQYEHVGEQDDPIPAFVNDQAPADDCRSVC